MKKLITFLLILIPVLSFSQNGIPMDSLMVNNIYTKPLVFTKYKPSFLTITFQDKELRFEVKGDSLIASGDLKPNKAAKVFIDYVRFLYTYKIDSLKQEIIKAKKQ